MIEPTPNHQIQLQAFDDWTWAHRNACLQDQYEGRVVAVRRKQVVAHGPDRRNVLEQIAQQGLSRQEVVIINVLSADFEVPPDHV